MHVRNNFSLIECILILALSQLMLISCSDENPFAPDGVAGISTYFPLAPGYSASYEFECKYYSSQYPYSWGRIVKGNCEIKVLSIHRDQRLLFSTLSSEYSVQRDYSWERDYIEEKIDSLEPYSFTRENDLLLSADSVWYVSDTSDTNQPGGPGRTLLMHLNSSDSCQLNLDFIVFPDWSVNSSLYRTEIKGDTLIYIVDDDIHRLYGGSFLEGEVVFIKGIGLESIDCTYGIGWETLSPSTWTVKYDRQ